MTATRNKKRHNNNLLDENPLDENLLDQSLQRPISRGNIK
jgi:hypothetical protein